MSKLLPLAWIIALCAVFPHSATAQTNGYSFTQNRQIVEVPMKLINNLPVIEVTLGDQTKLNFILDTGIRTGLVFSKRYLKGLDYTLGREISFAGLGNESIVRGKLIPNLKVNIGDGVEGHGISFVVLNENSGLKRKFGKLNIHGVIGYAVFARFVVELDYHNRMISFCEHGFFDYADVYDEIPLLIADTKPYINASLTMNGTVNDDALLMLDTGSSTTLLYNMGPEFDYLVDNKSKIGTGLSGEIKGGIGNLQELKIQSLKMKNIPILLSSSSKFDEGSPGNKRTGSIGGGLFLAYSIVFDYAHNKFYTKRKHPSNNRVVVSL